MFHRTLVATCWQTHHRQGFEDVTYHKLCVHSFSLQLQSLMKAESAALQAHKGTLLGKVAERKADLAALQVQRASAEAECAELAARVAAQTYSKEDVVRMTADKCEPAFALGPRKGAVVESDSGKHKSRYLTKQRFVLPN